MKLTDTICFSKLLWLLTQVEFNEAVTKMTHTAPDYANEGMAGYIETKLEMEVRDITKFSKVYEKWYTLSDREKTDMYSLALGKGCR